MALSTRVLAIESTLASYGSVNNTVIASTEHEQKLIKNLYCFGIMAAHNEAKKEDGRQGKSSISTSCLHSILTSCSCFEGVGAITPFHVFLHDSYASLIEGDAFAHLRFPARSIRLLQKGDALVGYWVAARNEAKKDAGWPETRPRRRLAAARNEAKKETGGRQERSEEGCRKCHRATRRRV
jgi:hypothetical protein